MSDEKKLPQDDEKVSPEDKKTCEAVVRSLEAQDEDRLTKELLPRENQLKSKPIPSHYESTFEFSATRGLEIFPIPPPPPQIVQQPVFRQSIKIEFATASLNQPTDTPNLLPSHPGPTFSEQFATTMDKLSGTSSQQVVQRSWSRKSAEVTANQPLGGPSLMPSQTLATQSSHGQLFHTVNMHKMATFSLSPAKSVMDRQSPVELMELIMQSGYDAFFKSKRRNIVPQTPPVTELSNFAQIQASEAAGQDDLSSGIQHSGKDDGKYTNQPQGQPVIVIQHTSIQQNVQDIESKKVAELSGHVSGFDSKDNSTDGKSSDMQNVAMDSEKNAGRQETMEEALDYSMKTLNTKLHEDKLEDKLHGKQRTGKRSRRSKSQKKR